MNRLLPIKPMQQSAQTVWSSPHTVPLRMPAGPQSGRQILPYPRSPPEAGSRFPLQSCPRPRNAPDPGSASLHWRADNGSLPFRRSAAPAKAPPIQAGTPRLPPHTPGNRLAHGADIMGALMPHCKGSAVEHDDEGERPLPLIRIDDVQYLIL